MASPPPTQTETSFARVLLVSHGYENIYERGFCNGLHDAGFAFTLVSSDQTDYGGLRPGTQTINLRGSQLSDRTRWQKAANLVHYHLVLMRYVARSRPPVLHVIGLIEPPLLCGVVQGLWFRFWAGRYALTVHNTERHDGAGRWSRWLYSWAFRIAPNLVVHTERVRDELVARHGIDPERIVVMQHGLEPLLPPPGLPATGRQPRPFRLLVFGKIMRYKGVDLLLEALRELPYPVVLTIAGRCDDPALAAQLQAQIAAHPVRSTIRWNNAYVPESEIPTLFTEADALVLAYRRIDQSGVLFQALRFGLPLVASKVGALEHYLEPAAGECCEPGDAASLRAALLRLIGRYAGIDRAQVRAIGQRYEWQRTVCALAGLYAAHDSPGSGAPHDPRS